MPMNLDLSELPAEIRRVRKARHLSLKDMEKETGVSAATLSRLEREAGVPEIQVIHKLATWLGVSVRTAGKEAPTVKTDEDLNRVIAVHLRANKKLPAEVARAIIDSFEMVMKLETQRAVESRRGSK